jgi:hypothetical protein
MECRRFNYDNLLSCEEYRAKRPKSERIKSDTIICTIITYAKLMGKATKNSIRILR